MPPRRAFTCVYGFALMTGLVLTCTTAFLYAGGRFPFEILDYHLDLAEESNLATWFSGIMLFVTGMVAAANGWLLRPVSNTPRLYLVQWAVVAFVLGGLSADEAARLHEWVEGRYYTYAGVDHQIPQYFGLTNEQAGWWLILYLPLITLVTLVLIWFITHILSLNKASLWLAVAGLTCWMITLIAEYVEAKLSHADIERGIQAPIEEGAEVIGTTLFLISFCEFLRTQLTAPSPHLTLRYK